MDLKWLVLIGLGATITGILLGLFIRVVKSCGINNMLDTFLLSFKFIIIYPLIFPFILVRNKDAFAEIFAKSLYKQLKLRNSENKFTEIKVKDRVANNLNTITVLKLWFALLKCINSEFDEYIQKNIVQAKDSINVRKKLIRKNLEYKVKTYQSKYLKELIANMDGFVEKEKEIFLCQIA